MEVCISKNIIKAIRICNGWTADLRVKLKYVDRVQLYWWIYDNRCALLGVEMALLDKRDPVLDKYTKTAVIAVINGGR